MNSTLTPAALHYDWSAAATHDADTGGPQLESQAFRDDCYEFLDGFIEFVRGRASPWYREPVDLMEVLRVEMLTGLRDAVRDWFSWRRLYDLRPGQVDVLIPAERLTAVGADLRAMAPPFDVRLSPIGTSHAARLKPWRAFRRAAYRFLDRWESRRLPRSPAPLGEAGKRRALFLDQHSHSVPTLLPLWRRLSADSAYQCLYVAGRKKVLEELVKHEVPGINLRRSPPVVGERELSPPDWNKIVAQFFAELEARHGMPTPPSVRRVFEGYSAALADAKLNALRLRHVFERFQPNVLVVSSGGHSPARIAELLARESNCLGLHLQHGLYKGDKEARDVLSEAVCLWGEFHRRRMELNPCNGALPVTGSPKHDELLRQYSHVPQNEQPTVAFYSTRRASTLIGAEKFDEHLQAVYCAARRLPQTRFVVKLHPAESRETVKRLAADAVRPGNVRVTIDDDAYLLLRRCHLAVTVSSTIGYEALLFGRPLLILNLTGRPDELPLPESCLSGRVTRAADLPTTIEEILSNRAASTVSVDDFWLNDGRSLDRIMSRIDDRLRIALSSSST